MDSIFFDFCRKCVRYRRHFNRKKFTKCSQLFNRVAGCCWLNGSLFGDASWCCVWSKCHKHFISPSYRWMYLSQIDEILKNMSFYSVLQRSFLIWFVIFNFCLMWPTHLINKQLSNIFKSLDLNFIGCSLNGPSWKYITLLWKEEKCVVNMWSLTLKL